MAIQTVPAAHDDAALVPVPRALLAKINDSLRRTIDRQVVIDDLCAIGLSADTPDRMGSLLLAIQASQGNDSDGLTDLAPAIDELLRVSA